MKKYASALKRSAFRLAVLVLLCVLVAIPAFAADWNGALKALQDGMKREQTEIDISAYDIPSNQFWDQYNDWFNEGKFPWYVKPGGSGWHVGNQETAVKPAYLDRSYDRNAYEARIQQIMKQTIHEGMSAWQIALSVHDYLITICEYDQRFYTDRDGANYTGYDVIMKGVAVCDGYTRVYMDIMNRAGIPCMRVVSGSDAMDHSWNLVKIGSDWYHVDVTWDDPSFNKVDVEGYVGHNYFLITDATISDAQHKHSGWDAPYKCTSTKYELSTNPYWKDVTSQIIWIDDTVSLWRSGNNQKFQIKRRDSNTAKSTILCEIAAPVIDVGSGRYYYSNYGLSYWNGMLYFADTYRVYRMPLTGGTPEVIHYHNTSTGRYIEGCQVRNGYIYLTLTTHGANRTEQVLNLPAMSHTHSYTIVDIPPTCVSGGYTQFTCSCGSSFTSGELPASADAHNMQETERKDPTVLEPGYIIKTCTRCGATEKKTLNKLTNPFKDVPKGAYYEESVMWAVAYGITSGTSKTQFSPDQPCTRAQVVTFLWRAQGSPKPKTTRNPFKDVKASEYYYDAVLWAVENKITSGTSKTQFSPDQPCTRGQVAAFLFRTVGDSPVFCASPFKDVKAADYFAESVMWAVENGITSGVGGGRFAPNDTCTRAQIVSFLRRADQAEAQPARGNISGYDPYTAAACNIRSALEHAPEGSNVYLVEINYTESTAAGYPLVEAHYYWQKGDGKQTQFWCLSAVNESGGFQKADKAIHVNGTYWVSTVIYDTDPVTEPKAYGYQQLDNNTCIEVFRSMTFE